MDPRLQAAIVNDRIAELHRTAARYRGAREERQPPPEESAGVAVTLRLGRLRLRLGLAVIDRAA